MRLNQPLIFLWSMQQTEAVVSWRIVVKAQETAQKNKFFKSLSFAQCNTLPLSGSSHFK